MAKKTKTPKKVSKKKEEEIVDDAPVKEESEKLKELRELKSKMELFKVNRLSNVETLIRIEENK